MDPLLVWLPFRYSVSVIVFFVQFSTVMITDSLSASIHSHSSVNYLPKKDERDQFD